MNASRHTASAEQTWRTRANKHGNSLCRCETGAGTRPRQGRQTAGETDGADPEGPSSLPRTPEAVRGSYGARAKEYGPNPAGARAELTAQTRRVQAVGHVRRRQCVAARTEYGHPGRHGIGSAAGNGVRKHAQEKPDGEPIPPTREGHTEGRRQICDQPRGTVTKTTEIIAEIHYLGDYLGKFRRSTRVARCNRDRSGAQYQVCPYSIERC